MSRLTAALCLVAAALAACAGGGDADAVDIDFRDFALSTDLLAPPASGAATLSVHWWAAVSSSPNGGYTIQAYAEPATGAAATATESLRFLQRNCIAPLGCGWPQEEACSFTAARRLSCSTGVGVTLTPGRYVAVAAVCTYDSSLRELCSERRQAFEVR